MAAGGRTGDGVRAVGGEVEPGELLCAVHTVVEDGSWKADAHSLDHDGRVIAILGAEAVAREPGRLRQQRGTVALRSAGALSICGRDQPVPGERSGARQDHGGATEGAKDGRAVRLRTHLLGGRGRRRRTLLLVADLHRGAARREMPGRQRTNRSSYIIDPAI